MPTTRKTKATHAVNAGGRVEFELKYHPTEKQMPFAMSSATYKLGGGARGGGKTYSLAGIGVALSMQFPGNKGFAGRRDMDAFRNTTLDEILQHIPKGLCREPCPNKTEKIIRIVTPRSLETGSEEWDSLIYYGELKDPNSLLSGNLGWFLIDEAFEVPKLAFDHLSGTLRHKLPDGSVPAYHGLLASNPSPGWLMDVFPVLDDEIALYNSLTNDYEDRWLSQPSPHADKFQQKRIKFDYAYFPFLAEDNPYLPHGYVQRLIDAYKDDPIMLARYVYGRWDVSMAGLIYQLLSVHRWNPRKPGQRLYMPGQPVMLGIDPSNGSGSYAAVVVQTWRDRIYVVDEYKQKGGTDDNFVDWLHAQPYANSIVDAVSDSARPDTLKRLRLMGIPARGAGLKDQIAQINALADMLRVDPSVGHARMLLDEAYTPQLIREFGLYQWKTPKPGEPTAEVPLKRNDDAINALQYLVRARWPVARVLTGPGEYRPARTRNLGFLGVRDSLRRENSARTQVRRRTW
jgi:PBSX family phage terminase large subunit